MMMHMELGTSAFGRSRQLKILLNNEKITLAGNRKPKIYGTLKCGSGRRMKAGNRVFFIDEKEAVNAGYRPCGHCLRETYLKWKALN